MLIAVSHIHDISEALFGYILCQIAGLPVSRLVLNTRDQPTEAHTVQ